MTDPLPYLPPEIITDILTRQPVKSLLRFRCVSKPWCSKIDSRSFIKAHLSRSLATGANLHVILGRTAFFSIDLDRPDRATEARPPFPAGDFSNSTNGLVLVLTPPAVLYNPFTRKYHKLPPNLPEQTMPGIHTLLQAYAVGYDSEKDDFLVVRVAVLRNRGGKWLGSKGMIYSCNSGTWRYTCDFPYPTPTERVWGVHLNGVLHTATNKVNGGSDWSIMGFNIRTEKHVTLPKPPITGPSGRDDAFTIEVLGGCLCMVWPRKKSRTDIWIMKEYGVKESWTLLLSVAPPVIESPIDLCPLVYSKDGQEVLLTHDHRDLTWYHLKKKTIRHLFVNVLPPQFYADYCVMPPEFYAEYCVASLFHPGPLRADQPRQSEGKKPGRSSSSKRDDFLAKGFRLDTVLESELPKMTDPLPNLPPEIITNILTRQPVKSLLRFRCVSKPWCSEIDSRSFKKAHLSRSLATGANLHVILGHTGFFSIDLDRAVRATEARPPFPAFDFSNSTNGLVLVLTPPAILYNPFTRKHHKLPPNLPEQIMPGIFTLLQAYAVGYDSEKDDFLVVRVAVLRNRGGKWLGSKGMIYSCNSGTWRYTCDFPYPTPTKRVWGVHLNGVLHTATNKVNGRLDWSIMGFDIRTEKHVTLPKPPITGPFSRDDAFTIEVLGGCLCMVRPRKKSGTDIWIMKEYGVKESWTLLLSVAPPVIESPIDLCPLVYSKDGQEVLLTHDHRRLTWYHLEKKTIRHLSVNGMPPQFYADYCVASLFHPGPLRADQPRQSEGKKPGRSSSSKRDDFLAKGFRLAL